MDYYIKIENFFSNYYFIILADRHINREATQEQQGLPDRVIWFWATGSTERAGSSQ